MLGVVPALLRPEATSAAQTSLYGVRNIFGRVDQHYTTSFGMHTARRCDGALASRNRLIHTWVSSCVDNG
jgi:hypothetical protein